MKRHRGHYKKSAENEHVKKMLGLYAQPTDKTQLVKKLKEIAERKKNDLSVPIRRI